MSLNAKLIVVGGDVKTEEIKLRLPSTIGRGRGTTIMLAHPLVSRQHCELYEADGHLMVRDLGSLNGTFVNNQRISEAALPPGDLLTIGTVTFRAVYEAQSDASPPSGPSPQLKTVAKTATKSAETIRANPPAAKPAPSEPAKEEDDEVVEFDFEKSLFELADDTPAAGNPTQGKGRLESTVRDDKAAAKKPTAGANASKTTSDSAKPAAKPAAPAAPPSKPAAPSRGDAATIDLKKPMDESDEDDQVDSSEDDDLDDFLKSLEKP
jgi:hypothetical protein